MSKSSAWYDHQNKDTRQGKFPEDDLRIPGNKKKQKKRYKVIYTLFGRDHCAHASVTEEQAREWIAKAVRGAPWRDKDFRVEYENEK